MASRIQRVGGVRNCLNVQSCHRVVVECKFVGSYTSENKSAWSKGHRFEDLQNGSIRRGVRERPMCEAFGTHWVIAVLFPNVDVVPKKESLVLQHMHCNLFDLRSSQIGLFVFYIEFGLRTVVLLIRDDDVIVSRNHQWLKNVKSFKWDLTVRTWHHQTISCRSLKDPLPHDDKGWWQKRMLHWRQLKAIEVMTDPFIFV